MTDLLALSERLIAEGDTETPSNRPTGELSEISDDVAVIEAFSHVVVLRSAGVLGLVDTSTSFMAPACLTSLRSWSDDPVDTIVYTHGHVDHVGGARTFLDEASERGDPRPGVVGHANVEPRFDRYDLTHGYNAIINARQFGRTGLIDGDDNPLWPRDWVRPTTIVRERATARVGDLSIELHHSLGETDDHLWGWIPDLEAVLAGDFLTWVFPNAGNPQKVQRYPLEWAAALRDMAARKPKLLLPAHGLPIGGTDLVAQVLDDVADVLERLVADVLELMNEGARLDTIVNTVAVDPDRLARPYLMPIYDEPEFVVRNIWRMYGGWYDGNPARLKPPSDDALSAEVAVLAGGADQLTARALACSDGDDHRMACQLIEWAAAAGPDDGAAHEARAEIYRRRRRAERSLMAKGIYGWASRESQDEAARLDAGEKEPNA
jgi:alkyl sulfatase BDS1-like metallo-beta-lactamase superfamily hydrolase